MRLLRYLLPVVFIFGFTAMATATTVVINVNYDGAIMQGVGTLDTGGLQFTESGGIILNFLWSGAAVGSVTGKVIGIPSGSAPTLFMVPSGQQSGSGQFIQATTSQVDATGQYGYTFNNVSAASYTIIPIMANATFTPATQTVTVATSTIPVSVGDFVVGTVPGNPVCAAANVTAWGECQPNGTQTASTYIATCTPPAAPVTQSCAYGPLACSSYTYSDWSTCQSNTQTRTVVSKSPLGCSGSPDPSLLTQQCTGQSAGSYSIYGYISGVGNSPVTVTLTGSGITTPLTTTTDSTQTYIFGGLAAGQYTVTASLSGFNFQASRAQPISLSSTYLNVDFMADGFGALPICTASNVTAWGECQTNGTQTVSTYISTCTPPSTPLIQSCTYGAPPTCATSNVTAWGECQTNGTQTASTYISTCTPPNTPLTQSCTYGAVPSVTPLLDGIKASDHPVRNRSQSDAYVNIDPLTAQIYSVQQTGTVGAFSLSTKDWATWQDMLIMYSGTTCGSKVPDISDYTSIISLTAPGVQNYSPGGGQMVGPYRFYWAGISSGAPGTSIVGQQNQSISLISQQTGCYYVFIYNTSYIRGQYALIWQQN